MLKKMRLYTVICFYFNCCSNGLSVVSRTSVLSNVRPLDPDVLQDLLHNARREICGSDLTDALSERSTPTTITDPPADDQYYSAQAIAFANETAAIMRRARMSALDSVQEVNSSNSSRLNDVTMTSMSRPTSSDSVQIRSSRQPPQSPLQHRNATPSSSFLPEIDPQGRMSTQRSTSAVSDSTASPMTSATSARSAQAPADVQHSKPLWKQSASKSSSKLDADSTNSEHLTRTPRPPKHAKSNKMKRNNSESVL